MLNERDEILVVSELYRMGSSRGPGYKLPGGALHPGEHLVDGAVREVLEETGVHARFESLACLRHWHGYRYEKSDIYFVCRLSALSTEITRQEEEIAECLWMPLAEYLAEDSGDSFTFNRNIVRAALDNPGIVPSTYGGVRGLGAVRVLYAACVVLSLWRLARIMCGRIFPVSPGSVLKEEIEHRGITQEELAALMGEPSQVIDEIICGRERQLLPRYSEARFRTSLGISAQFWLNLETAYRMTLTRQNAPIHIAAHPHRDD